MRVVVPSAALDKIRRCFRGSNRSGPMAATAPGRLELRWPRCRSCAWRSSSGAATRRASSSCRGAGWSSAPSPGSDETGVLPWTSRSLPKPWPPSLPSPPPVCSQAHRVAHPPPIAESRVAPSSRYPCRRFGQAAPSSFCIESGFSNLAPYTVESNGVRMGARSSGLGQTANGVGKILGPFSLGCSPAPATSSRPRRPRRRYFPPFCFSPSACCWSGCRSSSLVSRHTAAPSSSARRKKRRQCLPSRLAPRRADPQASLPASDDVRVKGARGLWAMAIARLRGKRRSGERSWPSRTVEPDRSPSLGVTRSPEPT